jgi:hypothetical protein
MASPQRISASWRVYQKSVSDKICESQIKKYLHDSIPVVASGDAEEREPSDAEIGERCVSAEPFARIVFVAN